MGSMHYCLFENTLGDLQSSVDKFEDIIEALTNGDDYQISAEEAQAAIDIIAIGYDLKAYDNTSKLTSFLYKRANGEDS